jgi:hypothetical protein
MKRLICIALLVVSASLAQAKPLVQGNIVERNGLARRATVLEQGIPITPMPVEQARKLVLSVPGFVEPEAKDENGLVRWLRVTAVVALPAKGKLPLRIEPGTPAAPPKFEVQRTDSGVIVESAHYRFEARSPGQIELAAAGRKLLSGPWDVELIGDARGILWGSYFRQFMPVGVEVEEQTPNRVTLLLKGFVSTNQRKEPNILDPGRRVDVELRLFLNACSPRIRFAWRLTNQLGHKTWLRRYALRLPLATASTRRPAGRADVALLGPLAVTADFLHDLGKGAGLELTGGGKALLVGGINMPPDGGYYSGRAPDIHRFFHKGMSRTFRGTLIPDGTLEDAAEALAPVDLVLAPQYYSDVKALPEAGDPVTFGEFAAPIQRAAEWLLANQWRGTLFWGEWYREWDHTRNEGVQEASNGHSPLAPLYHYWRTGDARFLRSAERSAQFVWDVQVTRGSDYLGWMFHTRRHLFDELDWIHPRYQRATGGLISSHVFLDAAARRDVIKTIRNFHEKYFDEAGVPHDWDKIANRRSENEDGVDTSNFMEALIYCYRETGDRYFLDAALKMSRWTEARYKIRGTRKWDDWNWNLTNYALRGLYTLYDTSDDPRVFELMSDMSRRTLANKSTNGLELKDGIGGGDAHFVFYHAWISCRIAKLNPDCDQRIRDLHAIVRREVARVRSDGLITLDHGAASGLPTIWTSYYDAKSLVAYVPVLSAHLASIRK